MDFAYITSSKFCLWHNLTESAMPSSSSSALLDHARNASLLAFYYTGDHLDRSSDNGWWLVDDLRTRSTRFPLEMSLRFVGEDRTEYTFKLAMKKYVETIGFDMCEFGHWSLDVQSPFIRNAVNQVGGQGCMKGVKACKAR